MIAKTPPIALEDERLDDAAGGADAPQRSRVTSLTVTFTAQTTSGQGDPDLPVVSSIIPNPVR